MKLKKTRQIPLNPFVPSAFGKTRLDMVFRNQQNVPKKSDSDNSLSLIFSLKHSSKTLSIG